MKTCPVSKKCGGCTYLQVPYEEQLKMKQEQVQKLFGRTKVSPIRGMQDPYHYRHKIYASFYQDKSGTVKAGLYEENSHRTVDSRMCLIQHTAANQILSTMCRAANDLKISAYDEDSGKGVLRHAYIRVSHSTGDILLVIVIGAKALPSSKVFVRMITEAHPEVKTVILNHNHERTSMILGKKEDILYGKGAITDRIGGISFRISSRSFYQVNPVQTEVLYSTALELAELKGNEYVLDVCCGIGTISLLAAQKAEYVVGVEISKQAVSDAIANAKANRISNARFFAEDAERFILKSDIEPDVVFLDPPRSGLGEKLLYALNRKQPEKVVYVSCNPVTQVRDLKILQKGGYRISNVVPIDMFPFTRHVETIVLMSR